MHTHTYSLNFAQIYKYHCEGPSFFVTLCISAIYESIMSQSTIKPESSFLFLPNLTTKEISILQQKIAHQKGSDIYFKDKMNRGGYASEMAIIPEGQFEMGSTPQEFGHSPEESPQSYITIRESFAIGRHTITANEFELFRQDTEWSLRPELLWSKGNYPVINIRSRDAKLYATWLSEQTGEKYRLPTEAEWEYAARAGTSTPFSFGDTVSCKDINFDSSFPYNEAKEKKRWYLPRCMPSIAASEVGTKPPNTWGLFDMHGNVWEFTDSAWTNSHLGINRDGSTYHSANGQWLVTKGGSWFDAAIFSRSAARKKRYFDEMDTNLGFRLVREI